MRLCVGRRFARVVALLAAAAALGDCSHQAKTSKPARKAPQRVFIIGFDGMDPTLVPQVDGRRQAAEPEEAGEEGRLPDLGQHAAVGIATAWSSFATGVNAGKHNIYDFLIRDFETYLPDLDMVKREPPEFLFLIPDEAAEDRVDARRNVVLGPRGHATASRSSILTVPVTFPPEEIEHGEMLAGLPLPDIRGTMGTYYYWATRPLAVRGGKQRVRRLLEGAALRR